jgi:hypothetical protein
MIRSTLSICLAASLLMACNNGDEATKATTPDSTTETKKEEPPPPPPAVDSATAAKNWQAYMTPGKEHAMMAKWVGTWTGEVSMWMAADAPPMKSVTTAKNKMVLGGRYQVSEHSGNFNNMPFEGRSMLAYDNHKKVFVSSWIDNMGTGVMTLEGPWDETSKSITLTGKMVDPSTGSETDAKEVFKIVDDNNQVLEMYVKGSDGKEFKTMEIKYKRKS